MSILIKGIEMPTTCRDCHLSTFTDFDSMPFCNVTMDDICFNDWETKRCDNCPLVPVPPHGALIDRDPFIEFIKTHWDSYDQWFVEQLEARPAIIPAEEGE